MSLIFKPKSSPERIFKSSDGGNLISKMIKINTLSKTINLRFIAIKIYVLKVRLDNLKIYKPPLNTIGKTL
jgi:hypothetical protein